MRRIDCHNRLKEVQQSYAAAFQTVGVLITLINRQPKLLYTHDLDPRTLNALGEELYDIYFVQMFASFESSLRHFWRTTVRNTRPLTAVLITCIAGRRGVPNDTHDTVQRIREFRNVLIHEENEEKERFKIDEASRSLNTYLARLPLEW